MPGRVAQVGRLRMDAMRLAPVQAHPGRTIVFVAHIEQADRKMLAPRQAGRPIPNSKNMRLRVREILRRYRRVVFFGRNSQDVAQMSRPDQGAGPFHSAVILLGKRDDALRGIAELN